MSMSIHVRKASETQYYPIFLDVLEYLIGGCTIATGALKTTTKWLRKGSVLGESSSTSGIYYLCKSAEVYEDSSVVTVSVLRNHEFVAGDYICNGTKSTLIASVTVGTDYDTIVGTAALEVSDGDVLYAGTSEGFDAADITQEYTPKCILRDSVRVLEYSEEGCLTTLDNVAAGAVVRGTVDESTMPYPVASAMKTSLTDRIRFA